MKNKSFKQLLIIFISLTVLLIPGIIFLLTKGPALSDSISDEICLINEISSGKSVYYFTGEAKLHNLLLLAPRFFASLIWTGFAGWRIALLKGFLYPYAIFVLILTAVCVFIKSDKYVLRLIPVLAGVILSSLFLFLLPARSFQGFFGNESQSLDEVYNLYSFLSENNIKNVYSTYRATNLIRVLSDGDITLYPIASYNDRRISPEYKYPEMISDNISLTSDPFYMVYSKEDEEVLIGSRRNLLGKCEYAGTSFVVYSYYYSDYVFDERLITDLLEFKEFGGDAEYETYFLSMYDIRSYSDEILDYMTGEDTYIFSKYTSSKPSERYFDIFNALILKSGDTKKVLWGIDPMIIYELTESDMGFRTYVDQHITRNVKNHPEITFRIFFPPHSLSYYSKYSEEEKSNIAKYYGFIVDDLKDYSNILWDFPGDIEWIYSNPYLFEKENDAETVADANISAFIGHLLSGSFASTSSGIGSRAGMLQKLVCEYKPEDSITSDLNNVNVVIFGDSIFDYTHNDTSIQDVLSNFSKADMLCYAICGTSAAESADGIHEAFGGELKSITSLKNDIKAIDKPGDRLVFIIEFGINDYMYSLPLDNPEKQPEIHSYKGSIRYYVSELRKAYPGCEILLLSPGYIYVCDNGNQRILGNSPILSDYRKASTELAEELSVDRMDLTKLKSIPKESYRDYLVGDMVHYNELGRLYIGKELIEFIAGMK